MNYPQIPSTGLFLIFIWSTVWKGFALWRAARYGQRNWFIAILVLNTIGILEIIYLLYFSKKKLSLKEISEVTKNLVNFKKSHK